MLKDRANLVWFSECELKLQLKLNLATTYKTNFGYYYFRSENVLAFQSRDLLNFPVPITRNMDAEQIYDLLIAPKLTTRTTSSPLKSNTQVEYNESPLKKIRLGRQQRTVRFSFDEDKTPTARSVEKSRFASMLPTNHQKPLTPEKIELPVPKEFKDDMPVFKVGSPRFQKRSPPVKSWFSQYKMWRKEQANLLKRDRSSMSKKLGMAENSSRFNRVFKTSSLLLLVFIGLWALIFTFCFPFAKVEIKNGLQSTDVAIVPARDDMKCPDTMIYSNTSFVDAGYQDYGMCSRSVPEQLVKVKTSVVMWPIWMKKEQSAGINVSSNLEDCVWKEERPCLIYAPNMTAISMKVRLNFVNPVKAFGCWIFRGCLAIHNLISEWFLNVMQWMMCFALQLD